MSRLLDEGGDPNVADSAGWTALHFAAQRRDEVQVGMLLERGADIEAADAFGNTALWRAIMSYKGKSPDAIRALKSAGANEHRENKSGVSPRKLAETIANYDVKSVL